MGCHCQALTARERRPMAKQAWIGGVPA